MPVLCKLNEVRCGPKADNYSRAQRLLPVMAELEEDLDRVVNGIGLNGVLTLARQTNNDVPSASRFRVLYSNFKDRLHNDPAYMQNVMQKLPEITGKYDGDNLVTVLSDPDFLDLLGR